MHNMQKQTIVMQLTMEWLFSVMDYQNIMHGLILLLRWIIVTRPVLIGCSFAVYINANQTKNHTIKQQYNN